MNLVDTADIYGLGWGGQSFGEAEENLGRILADAPHLRDQMVLATKGGIVPGVPYNSGREAITAACEASLRRLQTDVIDLYQIHRPDMLGESLESAPRYRRTLEWMHVLRTLLDGQPVDFHGEFVDLSLDPPRARTVSGRCPMFYFGGFSEAAKDTAAEAADVFLTWPDTVAGVDATIDDMRARAERRGRTLRFGLRSHVIVRETSEAARAAAAALVSRLDDEVGAAIRGRSLDAASAGVRRQAELRELSDSDGYAEANLWTGIGRARSGAGAAIVGDPDEVVAKLQAYRNVGIDAFILSGYPHLDECNRVGRKVLPRLEHGYLARPDSVLGRSLRRECGRDQ